MVSCEMLVANPARPACMAVFARAIGDTGHAADSRVLLAAAGEGLRFPPRSVSIMAVLRA